MQNTTGRPLTTTADDVTKDSRPGFEHVETMMMAMSSPSFSSGLQELESVRNNIEAKRGRNGKGVNGEGHAVLRTEYCF